MKGPVQLKKTTLRSIVRARCPACHEGPILHHIFGIHRHCSVCGHNFFPESGYFLGAMSISFLLTAMLTIPPMVVLKLMNVDIVILLAYPFLQLIFLGSFLLVYSRVLWIHLDYRMTMRLDGRYETQGKGSSEGDPGRKS